MVVEPVGLMILDSILAWLRVLFTFTPPTTPAVVAVSFGPADAASNPKDTESMATPLVGTVALPPVATNVPVLTQTVSVALNGTTLAPISVDGTATSATFPCNAGDAYAITLEYTSAGGVKSAASPAATGTANDQVTAPTTPALPSVVFAPVAAS
jgi:hypothetical protein